MISKSNSVHCVSNKVHDLTLMLICVEHFLNLKLHQHWSDWSSYACAWAFACSWWSSWEHQLDDLWVCRSCIQKMSHTNRHQDEIACFIQYMMYWMRLQSHVFFISYALEFWLIFGWIILHFIQSATFFTPNHSWSAKL